jgi:hypothetical protein
LFCQGVKKTPRRNTPISSHNVNYYIIAKI